MIAPSPFLVVWLMLLDVPDDRTCMCIPASVDHAIQQADAIFVGMVTGVRDRRENCSATSAQASCQAYGVVVTFRPDAVFKGRRAETIRVATGHGGGDCGYEFEPGKRYLVYASSDGDLWTSICTRTSALEDAREDLAIAGFRSRDRQRRGDESRARVAALAAEGRLHRAEISARTGMVRHVELPEEALYGDDTDAAHTAMRLLQGARLWGIRNAPEELVVVGDDEDEGANVELTFRQSWRGMRVYGALLHVRLVKRADGYHLVRMSGVFHPDVRAVPAPSLSAQRAAEVARDAVNRGSFVKMTATGDATLAVMPWFESYRAVWRIVMAAEEMPQLERVSYVDARTGEMLFSESPSEGAWYSCSRGRRQR